MKRLETFVLTGKEAYDLYGFHPVSKDHTAYCAIACAAGKPVLYQFHSNWMSATLWALEKSVWEYTA